MILNLKLNALAFPPWENLSRRAGRAGMRVEIEDTQCSRERSWGESLMRLQTRKTKNRTYIIGDNGVLAGPAKFTVKVASENMKPGLIIIKTHSLPSYYQKTQTHHTCGE
jgi:hypothetical protein